MSFEAGQNEFRIGRVVGRTFSLIGRNFFLFVFLAIVFAGAPYCVVLWAEQSAYFGDPELAGPLALGGGLVSFLGSFLLQAAFVRAAIDDLTGKGASIGSALSAGLAFMLPLLGLGIMIGVGLVVGFLLLVIPGLILMVRWIVAAPVLVVEQGGLSASMARSADLTEGHRWAIFGLCMLYFIPIVLASMTLSYFVQGAVADTYVLLAADVVLQILASMLSTVGVAAIYFELRQGKDGVGVEDLARTFE